MRVTSGDGSEVDGKWVLAYAQEAVAVPSELNFDNILVWSGTTGKAITIDLELVKLNKADKERMEGYLAVADLVAGAIPTYGAIAQGIVKAGEAINKSRGDYTVLLAYRAGFHPDKSLKYAAYALMPQDIARQQGLQLWYYLPPEDRIVGVPEEVRLGDSALNANWGVFRVIKGSHRTFEYGRAESIENIRKLADNWISTLNPLGSTQAMKDSVEKLISSVEAQRITKLNPSNLSNLSNPSNPSNKNKHFKPFNPTHYPFV
jgi:hypothetical protein